ncbi:hypothetical protein C2W62_42415 [Candidatus Entotheonella serta]|nr:hypothetical protein C2W62_42415 [Candidatus Entotheonella serta]
MQAQVGYTNGDAGEALAALTEWQTLPERDSDMWFQAEGMRLKGECLLLQSTGQEGEAEVCFQQALQVARRQSAKYWELRAAISLARLWYAQGRRQDAHNLLAPVYNWFTEGFDTADLIDAKALLDELAG